MSIEVRAEGLVLGDPVTLEPEGTVAFILGTRQEVFFEHQRLEIDQVPTCEVVCRDDVATSAAKLDAGAEVVVSGTLHIQSTPTAFNDETGWQRMRLELYAQEVSVVAR